jgi:hypothetical protein
MSRSLTLLDILSIPHVAATILSMATPEDTESNDARDTLRCLSRDYYAAFASMFFQRRRLNTAIPLYMIAGRLNCVAFPLHRSLELPMVSPNIPV